MTAEVHPLPGASGERSVYLDAYLAPFAQWLARDTVTEIIVNRPGEVWIEDAAQGGMQRVDAPEIDDRLVQRLAEQVARVSHQGINREHPLLGATLPDGARIQFCGPPATRKHWAMAIRRHRRLDLPLDAYDAGPLRTAHEAGMLEPEYARIIALCQRPVSVAEVAARVDLPLPVVKVMLSDLIEQNLVLFRTAAPVQETPNRHVLQAVLDGIRKL